MRDVWHCLPTEKVLLAGRLGLSMPVGLPAPYKQLYWQSPAEKLHHLLAEAGSFSIRVAVPPS